MADNDSIAASMLPKLSWRHEAIRHIEDSTAELRLVCGAGTICVHEVDNALKILPRMDIPSLINVSATMGMISMLSSKDA